MSFPLLLGLVIASAVFFILYVVLSIRNYRIRFEKKYDIRNTFPYEFNYESRFGDNVLGNISLIMSATLSLAFFALAGVYKSHNGFAIAAMVVGIVYAVSIVCVNFIPLKYLKTHIVFAALIMIAAFGHPIVVGLTSFNHYQDFRDVFSLVLFIICCAISLFAFGLAMNPRLSLNFKMQVATDEKGNEYYIRPKFIMFAFTEWIGMFILFITEAIFLVILNII